MDNIKGISCTVDLAPKKIGTGHKIKLIEPHGVPSALKNPVDFQWHGRDMITHFIANSTKKYMTLQNASSKTAFFVPSLQMGKFFIENDQEILRQTLSSLKQESNVALATAYFNIDKSLSDLVLDSKASWDILTASPHANGFLGSKGFSGMIPYLYLNQEYSFLKKVHKQNKTDVRFYEWEKEANTFHAKGLWISENKDAAPHISICGSSNFGLLFFLLAMSYVVYFCCIRSEVT